MEKYKINFRVDYSEPHEAYFKNMEQLIHKEETLSETWASNILHIKMYYWSEKIHEYIPFTKVVYINGEEIGETLL